MVLVAGATCGGTLGAPRTAVAGVPVDRGEVAFPVTASGSLLYAGGKPFFYLADTAWMLPAAASTSDATTYLQTRAAQGFTAIQMYLTPWAGHCDPDDDSYWSHVETVVRLARDAGLVAVVNPGESASLGGEYGRQAGCLGERASRQLAGYDNLMWFVGGDESPATAGLENLRAMVRGIRVHDAGHLISYHGALDADEIPADATAAYAPLFAEPWLGYAMSYDSSYFAGSRQNYVMTYGLSGHGMPVVLGESEYEGQATPLEVRQPHYWSLLAGGVGGAFGAVPTMNMVDDPNAWQDTLESPGVEQMRWFKRFATTYPWYKYEPDNSVVVAGGGSYGEGDFVTAAVADDRTFIVAYLPVAQPVSIDPRALGAERVALRWFDPSTGETSSGGTFDGSRPIETPLPPSAGGDMALALVPD